MSGKPEHEIGFHDVYAKYVRDVHRFALYLSGDTACAEDLTSETFLRMWQADGWLHASSVKAYLLAITRNLYLHDLRHARRSSPIEDAGQMPSPGSLANQVERRQELERVLEALQKLPELDRAALLLRVNEDLPYEEIARLLRISVAAAKVKVHRARLRLAEVRERSMV